MRLDSLTASALPGLPRFCPEPHLACPAGCSPPRAAFAFLGAVASALVPGMDFGGPACTQALPALAARALLLPGSSPAERVP